MIKRRLMICIVIFFSIQKYVRTQEYQVADKKTKESNSYVNIYVNGKEGTVSNE